MEMETEPAASQRGAERRRTVLQDEPPSAKLVAIVLREEGPLTRAELVDATRLPKATVKTGIKRLDEQGVLERPPNFDDLRKTNYRLSV